MKKKKKKRVGGEEKETKKGKRKASRKISMKAQEIKSLNYIPLHEKSRLQRESEHRTMVEKEHSEETRLQHAIGCL